MPVENEIKHVLSDPDGTLMRKLAARRPGVDIDQFYVNSGNRFRRSDHPSKGTRREHTFKLSVSGRVLEIETDVSEEDFTLASQAARERVVKRRFSFNEPDAHWDVDFLYTAPSGQGGSVRFVMAEAEFPEGATYQVPDIILEHLDFIVPKGFSSEFTNRKLADEGHVHRVMRDVAPRLRSETPRILEQMGSRRPAN